MKKLLVAILFFLLTAHLLDAQEVSSAKASADRFVKTWRIDPLLGIADTVALDTAHINFNTKNLQEDYSIANAYNSNYGSPLLSKIYMKREHAQDFIFAGAYQPYIWDEKSLQLYDVNFPYTHLKYMTGGPTGQKEEQIHFLFTASPSRKLNFGMNLDFLYAVGMFNNQAVQRFGGNLFGRYNGEKYSATGMVAVNNHLNHENGGLTDLSMLNNPNVDVKTKDMPVAMHGYSVLRKNVLYYNHNYSLGFTREIKLEEDSIAYEFVPVTRFGHTLKLEEYKKRYHEPSTERNFYPNTFNEEKNGVMVNDTAALRTVSNLFSINLAEEFNKWLRFGATAYVENEIQQFILSPDTILLYDVKSNTRVGGQLSKLMGSRFNYNVLGDIYLLGYKLGEFRLEGKMKGNFDLLGEQVALEAGAFVRNETPSFFVQNYKSAHFWWDNHFTKIYKTRLEGALNLPKLRTRLQAGVENVTNSIYFDHRGEPVQYGGNVQVLAVDLRQDLKFKSITLENNVIYQLTSNEQVIPLPTLALFHNLYYSGKWFVDLYPQFGVNMRYHTRYKAPAYMPAIAQFYNQNVTEIGAYPELNVYANFQLKTARFYLQYNNIGSYFLDGWGFYMPNYPINPPMLKVGILWNFFN